jgi:hypothetical protein
MLSAVMRSVFVLNVNFHPTECCYAECCYAECC